MIGKYVQYKNSDSGDKKQYLVVDCATNYDDGTVEIAIIQEFPYYPNEIKQLKIWQNLEQFNIIGKQSSYIIAK